MIAEFDGLQLLLVPNQGIVYDAAKAEERDLAEKHKVLDRLEAARKKRAFFFFEKPFIGCFST